jgi:hypothetical protein
VPVPGRDDVRDPQEVSRRRDAARAALRQVLAEIQRVIIGQDAMLERVLVSLLAGGHVLLEGVPGLAKTLTVRTLAESLGGSLEHRVLTPAASTPSWARCSGTSCSPTRSTVLRPRSNRHCWR